MLFWDLGGFYPGGTYTVQYDGEGTLEFGGAPTVTESRPGRVLLQVDPARGGITLFITATTPGNHVRNIRVLMPGGICRGDPFRYAADASPSLSPESQPIQNAALLLAARHQR